VRGRDAEPGAATGRVNGEAVAPEGESTAEPGAAEDQHGEQAADATAQQAANARLSRDDVRKLQAALFELGECRRVLDAALKDDF
jgi:hypothetical protein